jgi:uncharacterized damage-inducible protein DinB
MVASIQSAHAQMMINERLLKRGLADLAIEHMVHRPVDRGNSIHWIVGHITRSRFNFAKALGIEIENPLGESFVRGTPALDDDEYPDMKEVIAAWEMATEKLMARMESITEAELKAAASFQLPTPDQTLVGLATFIAFHETYHVGQISFVKKLFGLDGLVD